MISIIIPNYNGERFLPACLDSISAQNFQDYEVILVDNDSSDTSISIVLDRYPWVTLIINTINRGYAGGCNDGIRISQGNLLLFLNTDVILNKDFLSELHTSYLKRPNYGMYAPKILFPDGSLQAAGTNASLSGSSWERGNRINTDISCEVFGPYGAAALFSREAIEDTGGFDDEFFLYVEETDLTFRARLAGYRCWYEPGAVAVHFHGGTVGRFSDSALYYLHRNTLWYVLKDYPFSLLFFALPFIVVRNLISLLYYMQQGRSEIVFRAKIDAIRGLSAVIRKRKEVFRISGKIRYHLCFFHGL